MNAAAMNPPTRVSSSGPRPIPRRCSSVAGIVIEFHSPMSRMNSTLPEAVDGDSVPNTASWRRYQGAITTANSPTAPSAAANGTRAGRGPSPPNEIRVRSRSHSHAAPSTAITSTPSLRESVASPASSPAAANARAFPRIPRAARNSAPATSGW